MGSPRHEVLYSDSFINLVSDDSEWGSILGDLDEQAPIQQQERFIRNQGAEIANGSRGNYDTQTLTVNANNANSPIDLTGPDTPHSDLAPAAPEIAENAVGFAGGAAAESFATGELLTEAACLQMCLDVLPDISIDHLLKLIRTTTDDFTRTPAACERIVAQLVDSGEYPKEQRDARDNRKRKHPDEEELSQFEGGIQSEESSSYYSDARALLYDVFLNVPQKHIESALRAQGTLFKAFGAIEDELRHYNEPNRKKSFTKCSRNRNVRGTEALLISRGSRIPKELHAARQKSEKESAKRRKAEEERQAEEANLQRAQAAGEMIECQCCFDDIPINRVTCCTGRHVTHHFCKPCAKTYVETELGSGRCRPVCFADSDCGGKFIRRELQDFLGTKSFERLEHMQQQEDLAAAGLDFLSECPFCDYKAECLPVEIDKEFRCMNPKCEKISCRLCNKETHVPLSCEEAKKDESVTMRHTVEEAMSAALIRYCNNCKHPFIKELGCNKMTCSHCRNIQCYVCSKNVKNYEHFSDGRGDDRVVKCPLHDDVEARHEAEVKKAADEALAKVQSERPDISRDDLVVRVSESIKRAKAQRDQAQARPAPGNRHNPPLVLPQRAQLNNIVAERAALVARREPEAQIAQLEGAEGMIAVMDDQVARRRYGAQRPHGLFAQRDDLARNFGELAPPAPQQLEPQFAEGQAPFPPPEQYVHVPFNPIYPVHALPAQFGFGHGYNAVPFMAAPWNMLVPPNLQPQPPQPMINQPELMYHHLPEDPNQQQ